MREALSSLRSLGTAIGRWLWEMGIAIFSISLQNQGISDQGEGYRRSGNLRRQPVMFLWLTGSPSSVSL
ncbi:unnamed protein product [Linum trigynum]|uniref:Uncharacterized protein n=1 Tax=Linum trigynum TaxID=586398 RepID=A0AAV2GUM5_9ROSI